MPMCTYFQTHFGRFVKWEDVCLPKYEGGLGLESLQNGTMCYGQIQLCYFQDILWVRWVHKYVIKEHSFWAMKCPPSVSWSIPKIMKLRPLVQSWIRYIVGNGTKTFLLVDNWHPSGPFNLRYGDGVLFNMGWRWARGRNPIGKGNHWPYSCYLAFLLNVQSKDTVVWTLIASQLCVQDWKR